MVIEKTYNMYVNGSTDTTHSMYMTELKLGSSNVVEHHSMLNIPCITYIL